MRVSNNYSNISLYNNKYKTTTSPIVFKGNEDVLNRIDSLNGDKKQILSEMEETDGLQYGFYRVHRNTQNAMDIARIRRQYEELNELLNSSSVLDFEKDQAILASFFTAMNNLADNKGFNKVFGYDKIKDTLMSDFVIKTMAKDRTSQGADVPNAILFFGPTGCGKTFFASALAEQTLSNVVNIDASNNFDYEKTFEEIKATAEKSKEDYENSKDDKKRTIIVINEFDYIANPDSPILEQLKAFMKDCSDKYKCTLFLTTNYPFDIDECLMDDEIITSKIGIPYADKGNADKIIKGYLKNVGKPLPDNFLLLEELFKGDNTYYSNQQICDILRQTLQRTTNPSQQDYVDTINQQKLRGNISQRNIDNFNNEMFYFRTYDKDNPLYVSQNARQAFKTLEEAILSKQDDGITLGNDSTLDDFEKENNDLLNEIQAIRDNTDSIENQAEHIEKVYIGGISLVDLWIDMEEGKHASENYATKRLKGLWLRNVLKDDSKSSYLISSTLNMIEKSNALVKLARDSYKDIIEKEQDLTPAQKSIFIKQQDSLLFFLVISAGIGPNDIINLQNNTIRILNQLAEEEKEIKQNAATNIFQPCYDFNILRNDDNEAKQKVEYLFGLLVEKINYSTKKEAEKTQDKITSFKNARKNGNYDLIKIIWISLVKEAQQYFDADVVDRITDRNITLLDSINENLSDEEDSEVLSLIRQQKRIEQKDFISRYKDDKNFKLLMNNPNINITNIIDDLIYYESIVLNVLADNDNSVDFNELRKIVSERFLAINQEYDINAQGRKIASLLQNIDKSINSQSDIISGYAQSSLSNQETQIAQIKSMVQYLSSIKDNVSDIKAYNSAIVRAKLIELQRDDNFKEIVPELTKLLPKEENPDIEEFMLKVDELVNQEKDEATKKKLIKAAAIIASAIAAGAAIYYFGPEVVSYLASGLSTEQAIPAFSSAMSQASFSQMMGNSGFMESQIPFLGRTRTEEKESLKKAAESLQHRYGDKSASEFKRLLSKEENKYLKGSALKEFGRDNVGRAAMRRIKREAGL